MKIESVVRSAKMAVVLGAVLPGLGLMAADATVYIRRGLVAQYDGIDNAGPGQHDNAATTWADLSGNGLHATKHANSNLVWFDQGWTYLNETKVNGVAPFVLPDNSPVNAAVNSKTFSIDCAVSPADYPAGNICYVYLGNLNGSYKGFVLEQNEQNSKKNAGAYFENNPYVRSSFAVTSGDQLTIAFTSTLTSHIFYKDGVFDSESTAQDKMSSTTTGFAIGGDRLTNRDFTFRGSFYAARFYNCKLTAEEVKINAALDAVRFFGKSVVEANAGMPEGWSLIDGPYLQCTRSGDFTYDGQNNLIEEDRQVLTGTTQTLSLVGEGVALPPAIVLKAGLSVAGNLKIQLPATIDNGTYTLIDATGAAGIELANGATISLADGCAEVLGQTRRLVIANDRVELEVSTAGEIVVIDDGAVHEYHEPISFDQISGFHLVDGTLWASAANVIPGDVGIAFMGGSYAPFGPKFTDNLDGQSGNLVFIAGNPIGLSAISNDLSVVAGDDETRTLSLGGELPSALLLNDLGADHRLTVSNAVSFAGAGEVEVRSTAVGADVVMAKKLSSTGNFDKTGAGTLQLRQGQNAQTVTAKKGTLVYSGDGTESSTLRELRSGETDADAAKISIASGTVGASGSFVVTRAGTVDQSGGTVTLGDTLYVGYEGTGGVYNMTGGTMSIPSKTFAINVGNKAGSKGVFNVSGNSTITDQGNMQVGLYGNGELNQSGGTITVTSWPAIGRYAGAYGVYNISGGTLRQLNASCGLIVGEEGNGVMNISGTGVVESAGPFYIGHAANATGAVNVYEGGKIIAPLVGFRNASKSSRLYVDGGTIAAAGSGQTRANFLGVPVMEVGPKGMTVDTGNNTVSVGEPFLKIAANGPIVKTGSGTLTAPAASPAPVLVQEGTLQASDDALPDSSGFLDQSALLHRWSLNGDLKDSVGGTTGTMVGAASWNDAVNPTGVDLAGGAYGTSCVKLGTNMLPTDGSAVTIEVWGKLHAARNYARVFNISWAVANQFTITWCNGTDATKVTPYIMKNGTNMIGPSVTTGSLLEKNIHLTVTVEPQADGKSKIGWIWRNLDAGTVMVSGSAVTKSAWVPADIAAGELMLGRSADTNDGDASASYDEVRIWKGIVPTAQLDRSVQLGPDYLPLMPKAKNFPAIDVADGATFAYGANNLTAEELSGVGTVSGIGTLTVTEKLDIAGTGVGTMTLDGNLAVAGEWVVDVGERNACDLLTGNGTLNLADAVISVRDPSKIRGQCVIATVGNVSGLDGARLANLPKRRLSYAEGRLSIVSDGLYIILQ